MRKNTEYIIGTIITSLLVIILAGMLGYIFRPTDTDSTYGRIKSFHELPPDKIDVIIYGSSHAANGVNTNEIYRKYGIGAYNYGTNWQSIDTVKLFVQDSLLTQSPKLAVIETFRAGRVQKDTDITGEIYFTRYLDNRTGKFQYLKRCFGYNTERWLSYYMPLCAFHDNWNSLTEQSFKKLDDIYSTTTLQEVQNMLGYVPNDTTVKIHLPNYSEMSQDDLSEEALSELDEIMTICKDNDIEVLFITIPYALTYCYNDSIEKYSAENGCKYLNMFDYMDEMHLDEETDFRDEGHLNTRGATKVADFLGAYIRDNYDLRDVRSDGDQFWDGIE